MKSFTCPVALYNNSAKGVALLNKASSLANETMKERIEPLVKGIRNEQLTLEEVKSLYSFLTKAKNNYQPKLRLEGGNPDSATCAFLAAGGNSGLAWTTKVLQDEGVLKSNSVIGQDEIDKEDTLPGMTLSVSKSTNEELQQATFVVMVPDETDLHGDVTTEDEVRKACHNFNKFSMKANLFHLVETDSFEFVESYVVPTDFILGDKFVKKGTWLCTIQCLDDGLWALIKSGDICSVSIGAMARVEVLEEENE